jgi:hypothetical protein
LPQAAVVAESSAENVRANLAAFTAAIPGAAATVAKAPVAAAAPVGALTSAVPDPVAPPADLLPIWAAALHSAITAMQAERVRRVGTVAATGSSLNIGLGNTGSDNVGIFPYSGISPFGFNGTFYYTKATYKF